MLQFGTGPEKWHCVPAIAQFIGQSLLIINVYTVTQINIHNLCASNWVQFECTVQVQHLIKYDILYVTSVIQPHEMAVVMNLFTESFLWYSSGLIKQDVSDLKYSVICVC